MFGSAPAENVLSPDRIALLSDPKTPVKMVFKWTTPFDASTEQVCTKIAEAFGLSVPDIQTVSPKRASVLISPMKKFKPAFSPPAFSLLVMDRMKGTTLSSLTKENFLKFNLEAWQRMMRHFGKASMLDLFIGNFDRFVRFDRCVDGSFVLVDNPSANGGNAIISLTPQRGKNIAGISMIDTNSILHPSRESSSDTDAFVGLDGLFEDGCCTPPPKKTPSPLKPQGNKAEDLHQFFQTMVLSVVNREKILLDHIFKSILKSVKEGCESWTQEESDLVLKQLEDSEEALQVGLLEGLEQLKKREFLETAQKIAEEEEDIAKDLLDYLQLNSKFLLSL
ncbi:MAG: hypothetical protein KGJ02_03485 [Verrucomicrobiota bacterium]|nr:hypothetical protein [Verrucomicrobiota bacterium]